MSQPPTGPTPGPSGDDTPRTPDEGEGFAHSPYDVPETQPGETAADYGQAPDPARTIYSDPSSTDPEPEGAGAEGGRPRWVLPAVIAAVVLLVAGGIAAALLLGGDDEDPVATPTAEQTVEPTTETTEQATTAAPTEEPTAEPTEEPSSELLGDLDETVSVGDLTFELSEEGFVPDEGIEGTVEAYRGTYVGGEERIGMLATLWPDNATADAFATRLTEGADGELIDTGDTYTNGTGTFWAFLLSDERGRYIWTTDRGHVLEITGSADYVSQFYSSLPL